MLAPKRQEKGGCNLLNGMTSWIKWTARWLLPKLHEVCIDIVAFKVCDLFIIADLKARLRSKQAITVDKREQRRCMFYYQSLKRLVDVTSQYRMMSNFRPFLEKARHWRNLRRMKCKTFWTIYWFNVIHHAGFLKVCRIFRSCLLMNGSELTLIAASPSCRRDRSFEHPGWLQNKPP